MISIAILVLLRTAFFINRKLFRSNLVANDLSAIIFIQSFSIIKRGFEILSHIAYIRCKRIQFNCYVSIFIVDFDTHVCHCWFMGNVEPYSNSIVCVCTFRLIDCSISDLRTTILTQPKLPFCHIEHSNFFPIFWNFRCTKKPLSHLWRLDFISTIHS